MITSFDRAALINAERQLRALAVLADCLCLADFARDRIEDSLNDIAKGLAAARAAIEAAAVEVRFEDLSRLERRSAANG